MDEFDAWNNFVTTGSVIDYLKYSSIKNSKDTTNPQEAANEIQYGRAGYSRTDNQGARQACHGFNKK
ncbi:MAG: hypothetical protein K2M82_06675 [Lachnospiraceae bacterium]|nr:hypothetical protein [Lachnospiraceae bacterium]